MACVEHSLSPYYKSGEFLDKLITFWINLSNVPYDTQVFSS